MKLFKFVDCHRAVVSMAKGNLKFTPIAQLNDPTEMFPVMNHEAIQSSLETLRRDGLTSEQFTWLHHQNAILDLLAPNEKILAAPESISEANRLLGSDVFYNPDYMEKKLLRVAEIIKEKIGILSLSKRHDSLPMWAHYAKQAHGFVVAFKDLSAPFDGDETGSLNTVKPVKYQQEISGMTFDPSTQDRLFFSKHSDWSYECEWRVVTALSACNRTSSTPSNDLYLRTIDTLPVASVICGWQVSEDKRQQLRDGLAQVDPDIEIRSATVRSGKVVLEDD